MVVALVAFIFISIDFSNKTYVLTPSSICSVDLMYSVKENLIFITIITAIYIVMAYKDFENEFSYNRIFRFSKRNQVYKIHLIKMLLQALISSVCFIIIMLLETFLYTKTVYNWNLTNSYYVFINGEPFKNGFCVAFILLFIYVFSFMFFQMLIALNLYWMNINGIYMILVLFLSLGFIMFVNRAMFSVSDMEYFDVVLYIVFSALNIAYSLLFVLKKIVPKREFFD